MRVINICALIVCLLLITCRTNVSIKSSRTQKSSKPIGLAVHIGTDRLDPTHYCDAESATLPFPESLARQMAVMSNQKGFSTTLLLGKQATVSNVMSEIDRAARQIKAGDIFLITFCGHGAQLPDWNRDETDDKLDETWCLYDGMLVDDVLGASWKKFKVGVRILIIADCCHSATSLDRLPDSVQVLSQAQQNCIYERNKKYYDGMLTDQTLIVQDDSYKASVKSFAACRDDQTAKNGYLTKNILRSMDGKFQGNYGQYDKYLKEIFHHYNIEPQFYERGPRIAEYDNSSPFSI